MLQRLARQTVKYLMTGSPAMTMQPGRPDLDGMEIPDLGLYLHVPFCRQPCFYCPYLKERYDEARAHAYAGAVQEEIAFYASRLDGAEITDFYIGGGTPTTMMDSGLPEIIREARNRFNVRCHVSMETHPNDVTPDIVEQLQRMDARSVSMGVESFSDRFLKGIGRPYDGQRARQAVALFVDADFDCVNVDIMFGLPDQTTDDVRRDIATALSLDVDQISAYPIFTFPHTGLEDMVRRRGQRLPGMARRREMLRCIEQLCYDAGMHRSGVWSFTRPGVDKYSSVTVPRYVGLGAGAGSLIPGNFYINVFDVGAYIDHVTKHREPPVALTVDFSRREEMVHWLYWRIYETRVDKREFAARFDRDFDDMFGKTVALFGLLGFAVDNGDVVEMTDRGNYWVHVLQNLFSLDFIGRVWQICLEETWPQKIALV
ncbi:MAG: coproporphyrinogen-III oxidase family protein [Thermoplasmatota archaeon]